MADWKAITYAKCVGTWPGARSRPATTLSAFSNIQNGLHLLFQQKKDNPRLSCFLRYSWTMATSVASAIVGFLKCCLFCLHLASTRASNLFYSFCGVPSLFWNSFKDADVDGLLLHRGFFSTVGPKTVWFLSATRGSTYSVMLFRVLRIFQWPHE